MSNSRSRINTVGTVLAATALIAGLSNSAQAQQTGVIRTVLMSDGCNYVHNPDGWLRVGCTLTDGQRLYFRNDMEGGVLYIWAAGPNGPFWQRLSVDAQVAHNQASDQKPARNSVRALAPLASSSSKNQSCQGTACISECERFSDSGFQTVLLKAICYADKRGNQATVEILNHMLEMHNHVLETLAR